MLKTFDGRDLVLNDGARITVPDGTTIRRGRDGSIWLDAFADEGKQKVSCELRLGVTAEYIRFVFDHQARELSGFRPRKG